MAGIRARRHDPRVGRNDHRDGSNIAAHAYPHSQNMGAAGVLLGLSGQLSILALIGLTLDVPTLTFLTLASGPVFLDSADSSGGRFSRNE
jgi:hypothetical protein